MKTKMAISFIVLLFIILPHSNVFGQNDNSAIQSFKYTDYISEEALSKMSYNLVYPLATYLRTKSKIQKSDNDDERSALKNELESVLNFESRFIGIGFEEEVAVVEVLLMVEKGYDISKDARLVEASFIEGTTNDFITAKISLSNLLAIILQKPVIAVEAALIMYSYLDNSTQSINARQVWNGNAGIDDVITGDGVFVAILDSRPLNNHETFMDAESNSRIVREFGFRNNAQVETHGTHVGGIASGRGNGNGQNRGVAFESKIIFANYEGPGNLGINSNNIINRIEEIKDYVLSLVGSPPIVLNMSFGWELHPKDGTTLFEKKINDLIENNNIIAVSAVGNNGLLDSRAHGIVTGSNQQFITVNVNSRENWDDNQFSVEMWYINNIPLHISIETPSGEITDTIQVSQGESTSIILEDLTIKLSGNSTSFASLETSDYVISIRFLCPGNCSLIDEGSYKINLSTNDNTDTGEFNLYTSYFGKYNGNRRANNFISNTSSNFIQDNLQSIGIPATAQNVLAVGALDEDYTRVAPYSALGPLRSDSDGIISKPDIVAPGTDIVSSDATGIDTYTILSGTSMAAPHVAGAAALLLQHFPNLHFTEVKEILKNSAWRPDHNYDPRAWGAGGLDILAAYKSMVGYQYLSSFYKKEEFVSAFEHHDSGEGHLKGLPISVVNGAWNGQTGMYKQKMTNGAILAYSLADGRVSNGAYWLGQDIFDYYVNEMSGINGLLGLPSSTEIYDEESETYFVTFENGKIVKGDGFIYEEIYEPEIIIISPSGGETWRRGLAYTIEWSKLIYSDNVNITLFKDGNFITTLAVNRPGISFVWTIPMGLSNGGNYTIRISSMDEQIMTESEPFSIAQQLQGHDLALHLFEVKYDWVIPTEYIEFSFFVRNLGIHSESNYTIRYRLRDSNGSVLKQETEIGPTLTPGQTSFKLNRTFSLPSNISEGFYEFTTDILLPNDQAPANNVETRSIYIGWDNPYSTYKHYTEGYILTSNTNINLSGYNVTLLSANANTARIRVQNNSTNFSETRFINRHAVELFDASRFLLIYNSRESSSQIIVTYGLPSNEISFSPLNIEIEAGRKGLFNFTQNINRPQTKVFINNDQDSDSPTVKNWPNRTFGTFPPYTNMNFEISPPLNATRKLYDFWVTLDTGSYYLQKLSARVIDPIPDFEFTLSSTGIVLSEGSNEQISINIVPEAGFEENIHYSILNVPSGLNATFSSNVTGPQGSNMITITSDENLVDFGIYDVLFSLTSSTRTKKASVRVTLLEDDGNNVQIISTNYLNEGNRLDSLVIHYNSVVPDGVNGHISDIFYSIDGQNYSQVPLNQLLNNLPKPTGIDSVIWKIPHSPVKVSSEAKIRLRQKAGADIFTQIAQYNQSGSPVSMGSVAIRENDIFIYDYRISGLRQFQLINNQFNPIQNIPISSAPTDDFGMAFAYNRLFILNTTSNRVHIYNNNFGYITSRNIPQGWHAPFEMNGKLYMIPGDGSPLRMVEFDQNMMPTGVELPLPNIPIIPGGAFFDGIYLWVNNISSRRNFYRINPDFSTYSTFSVSPSVKHVSAGNGIMFFTSGSRGIYAFNITDPHSLFSTFPIELNNTFKPKILDIPNIVLQQNEDLPNALNIEAYIIDEDTDYSNLNISLMNPLPTGLEVSINENNTSYLSITTTNEWFGEVSIDIVVTDNYNSTSGNFKIIVEPTIGTPMISGLPNKVIHSNVKKSFDLSSYISGQNIDINDLSYQLTVINTEDIDELNLTVSGSVLEIEYTGNIEKIYEIEVKVEDSSFNSSTDNFLLTTMNWLAKLELISSLENYSELYFGASEFATSEVDDNLGEFVFDGVSSSFDARFVKSHNPPTFMKRDFRNSTANSLSWRIQIIASESHYPIEINWSNLEAIDGLLILRRAFSNTSLFVDMTQSNSITIIDPSIKDLEVIYHQINLEHSVHLVDGWNLLSLPRVPVNAIASTIFPEVIDGSFFTYNGTYINTEILSPGVGFWLRTLNQTSQNVFGMPISQLYLELNKGWNLIGGLSNDFPISFIQDENEILENSIFFKFNNTYEVASIIEAGYGYWVHVDNPGVIILNSNTAQENQVLASDELTNEFHHYATINYKNVEVTRTLSTNLNEKNIYMPPLPPGKAFDVRWLGGEMLLNNSKGTLLINGLEDKYTLRLNTFNQENYNQKYEVVIYDKLGNSRNILVHNGESIPLSYSEEKVVIKILADNASSSEELPEAIMLAENYPNPFNPTTKIRYGLPESAFVKLDVYNIVGQRVATLVNAEVQAGWHTVMFDGSRLSSGMYIYRLHVGDFVQTRKMILIK